MSSNSTCTYVPQAASEQLCYIHCNFCNIVLAVSVPCNSLFDTVTVRCENCSSLWPVNVGMTAVFHQSLTGSTSSFQDSSSSNHQQVANQIVPNDGNLARPGWPSVTNAQEINDRPPEKRQRIPSMYNLFIREEIKRIKARNPNICHKEAFSTAAKNWAHFPQIQFGLELENNHHQANLDKDHGFRNHPNDKA